MSEIANILAAVDLSKHSRTVLDRGLLLARANGARCTIVHALGLDPLVPLQPLAPRSPAPDDLARRVVDEARQRVKKYIATSQANGADALDLRIEPGLAGRAIPDLVRKEGVDLVVAGAHGSGFLRRLLLGSTTSRLLRKCACPVLVVKRDGHRAFRRVLVAVDFSPCSIASLRLARQIAPDANLALLHVAQVPFEGYMQYACVSKEIIEHYRREAYTRASRQLDEVAQAAGLEPGAYSAFVVHGDATRSILEHEKSFHCDLIVMGKHGTHVTEELLLGSVTNRVLAQSTGDVLVVIDKRQPDLLQTNPSETSR